MLRVGALVTHADVVRHPLVAETMRLLGRSFAVVGNVRVRTAATVGGVVAEADYASDPPTALLALDATVVARSRRGGERTIPILEFFIGFYETALLEGEARNGSASARPSGSDVGRIREVSHPVIRRPSLPRRRRAVDRAADGTCDDFKIAVGATSETPVRFYEIERAVIGEHISPGLAAGIGDAYAAEIDILDDARGTAEYRREMVRVWVKRTILAAVDGTTANRTSS